MKADHCLIQFITEPIRIAKSSVILIYQAYCSVKAFLKEAGVANLHLLDHFLTYCVLNINDHGVKGCTKPIQFRSFAKVDSSTLKLTFNSSHGQQQPWSIIYGLNDTDEMVNSFNDTFRVK